MHNFKLVLVTPETAASSLKKEGETCGFCECPETDYSAGACEGGLDCEINPNLPSEGGICKRPSKYTLYKMNATVNPSLPIQGKICKCPSEEKILYIHAC